MAQVRATLALLALVTLSPLAALSQDDKPLESDRPNALLQQFVDQGVTIDPLGKFTLPPPAMSDGLSVQEQQAALKSISDARHPPEALLRKSVVSPFVLRTKSETGKSPEDPKVRRIDLWFVAYGDLTHVTTEGVLNFLKEMNVQGGDDSSGASGPSGLLDESQVLRRQLRGDVADPRHEQYYYNTFVLFDRVEVRATRRSVLSFTPKSVTVAWHPDPRFNSDPDYPNQWVPLDRGNAGTLTPKGKPHIYENAASYVKLTQLSEPAGAIFVEYHMVFEEPRAWFNGANLLGSKVPIIVQDTVRRFRRKIVQTLMP